MTTGRRSPSTRRRAARATRSVAARAAAVALVAGGGALGSAARYLLSLLALRWVGGSFPAGTLAVNILGCLAAGVVATKVDPQGSLRIFLIPGLLGGFTTFSAFGLETQTLIRDGRPGLAAAYVGLSVGAGLGAVLLGHALSR